MSASADIVTVPVAVPRDPPAYRATAHFQQRLKERVPERRRDTLPGRLIDEGRVSWTGEYRPNGTDKGTPVAFSDEIAGETWTMIVALRPDAFGQGQKHAALTVYQGAGDQAPATADDSRGVSA